MRNIYIISVFFLLTGAMAQKPEAVAPILKCSFEADTESWMSVSRAASVQVTHNSLNVKVGAGALEFTYTVQPKELLIAMLPVYGAGELRSIRFWLKTDEPTIVIVVLSEADGSAYQFITYAFGGKTWQHIEANLTEFSLQDDSKDENNRLDPAQINAVAVADLRAILSSLITADQTGTVNFLKILLGERKGTHKLWLDEFEFSRERVPGMPMTKQEIVIDNFDRDTITWIPLLGLDIKPFVQSAAAWGKGLQLDFTVQSGKFIAMMKDIRGLPLSKMDKVSLMVAATRDAQMAFSFEELDGSRYIATFNVSGATQWQKKEVTIAEFKLMEDTKDENERLDLDQAKLFGIAEISGMTGGLEGKNTLWIDDLRAILKQ